MPSFNRFLLLLLIVVTILVILIRPGLAKKHDSDCRSAIQKARRLIRSFIRHRKLISRSSGWRHRYHSREVRSLWSLLLRLKTKSRKCFKCFKLCRDIKYKYAILRRLLRWVKRQEKRLNNFSSKYVDSPSRGNRYKSAMQVQYEYLLRRAADYRSRLGRCRTECHQQD
ncbi:hypothetical protein BOX15_Mlig025285g1 [Macrostomum lignano]|uniref:Secreted protein n=2 Tax=Macrostomum lignano TaxID=282301 RepID=A0A1I8J7W0_9PLAT|nr:hypothetical protein BOX15_Mlig025285g1 [Macrostomum lignano]